MNVLTVPRTVASLEYSVLRAPAALVESKLIGRLDEESRVRLAYERALGSIDQVVGRLLADEKISRRGTALARRADVLETAVRLEEKAEQRKAAADEALREQKSAAQEQRRTAEQDKADETRRLREQEKARKQAIKDQADAKEKAAAASARRKADAELQSERQRVAQQEARIEQRTEARTAASKAQLETAVERKSAADAERADADRLAKLAGAEKQRRAQARG
jgi:hypothetical protein